MIDIDYILLEVDFFEGLVFVILVIIFGFGFLFCFDLVKWLKVELNIIIMNFS